MSPPESVGIALSALIVEAVTFAKERAGRDDADAGPLCQAIRRFSEAYHRVVEAEAVSDATPARFAAAIRAIDPGIYDVTGLARALVTACDEVGREHGLAAADPAVRLIACQIAVVCEVSDDLKAYAHLMFDCIRHVLNR